MRRRLLALAALLLAPLAARAQPAFGDDARTYAGDACTTGIGFGPILAGVELGCLRMTATVGTVTASNGEAFFGALVDAVLTPSTTAGGFAFGF